MSSVCTPFERAVVPRTHSAPVRLLAAYEARISAEGEYDEAELPGSLMDDLEGAAGPERQAFAVRGRGVLFEARADACMP